MSDFFTIELDTTAPDIEISMPAYTGRENWNEIVIQSDERLEEKQEFYFIDSLGKTRETTFSYEENRFLGEIRFNDFPNGIALLKAIVWDEVGNPSAFVEKAINVIGASAAGVAELQLQSRTASIELMARIAELTAINRNAEIVNGTRNHSLQTRTRTGGIVIE